MRFFSHVSRRVDADDVTNVFSVSIALLVALFHVWTVGEGARGKIEIGVGQGNADAVPKMAVYADPQQCFLMPRRFFRSLCQYS